MYYKVVKPFYKKHTLLFRLGYFALIIWLLLAAMTAYWLQRQFYDTQRFTETATTAISLQSSRESIASAATKRALENKPLLQATISSQVEGLIVNTLGSDASQKMTQNIVERLQLLITTPRKDPLIINLSSLKAVISAGQSRVAETSALAQFDVASIPDSITVIDTANIPNVYELGLTIQRAGPIAVILAIIGMAYWIYRGGRRFVLHRISIAALVLAIAGIISVIIGPLVRPGILSLADDVSTQTLIGNLYDAFMSPFTVTSWVIVAIGITVSLTFAGLNIFSRRYALDVRIKKK